MIKTLHETLGVLIAIAALVTVTAAQQSVKLEDPPWIKEVAPARIVYSIPGMERITAKKDVTYKRVAGAELKMDVYQPPNLPRGARRPAIVFIHGGALPPNLLTKPKEWGSYVSFGQLAAASGFVGITFNQRFHGWNVNDLSQAQDDVNDAIKYVRDNAQQLNLDNDHISLWTLSAGSLLVGPAMNDTTATIRCLVLYYPIVDLEPLRKDRPAITDEAVTKFSLVRLVRESARSPVAMFVARAGREEPALNDVLDSFIKEALRKKTMIDLSNHAEGHHGFDVLDNNDRSREIIKRTLEFVRAHGTKREIRGKGERVKGKG